MGRIGWVGTLVAVLALGGSSEASAQSGQSSEGWWEWALREVARERGVAVPDVLERSRDRDGGVWGRKDRDRRDRDRQDRDDDRWDDDGRWERDGRGRGEKRGGKGPPFCRNGRGHPVHGLEWCRRKGFGVYDRSARRDSRWGEGRLGEILFPAPRPRDRRDRVLDPGGLIDVLGEVVFGRVRRERNRLGARAPLAGRWVDLRTGGRVLQIRAGRVPVAELSDVDGDGRVDVTLVAGR